ncbi:M14 family metallopeptidase [Alteribacillus sp. JSM 102045]|uniref:M14 family metallopeptidase n=1 Tax=Alteribacillus sp. JSM 102045 TaxID=1562101 RepID=UPI0035BF4BA1
MISYKIKKGDTLAKVAFYNKVRIEDLLFFNKEIFSRIDYLTPGNYLQIPDPGLASNTIKNTACFHEYGWRELEQDREYFNGKISSEKIGTSRMGKPVWLFKTGHGPKKLFFSGTWHGNEWLNTWLLMQFLKVLQNKINLKEKWNGIDIDSLLGEATIYVVALVNPDGAELVQEGLFEDHYNYKEIKEINDGFTDFRHWSANAAGVDLNHQWPAGWKEEALTSPASPFPRHYGGEAPLTEPETRAVYQLTMKEEFSYVLTFHSQGEEIYWGYRDKEPPVSSELANRLARASSFKSVRTADSKAGYKDWFINEFKRPGFTIETGAGQNPLPFESSVRIWITSVPLILESLTFPKFS